jgi:hypothetical protein
VSVGDDEKEEEDECEIPLTECIGGFVYRDGKEIRTTNVKQTSATNNNK